MPTSLSRTGEDASKQLLRLASEVSEHALTPYSDKSVGAIALLSDGTWIPGVRIENASFPLTISALMAAYTTCRCAKRTDIVAVAQSVPFRMSDPVFLMEALGRPWQKREPDVLVRNGLRNLPTPTRRLELALDIPAPKDDAAILRVAEDVARRAFIPESGFPVGCVVTTEDGPHIPGCNVEHSDWTRGLCAERVGLATARAYGHHSIKRIHLVCPHEPNATPCGACRQVMFELARQVPIVMRRGDGTPETATVQELLPGGFSGDMLRA